MHNDAHQSGVISNVLKLTDQLFVWAQFLGLMAISVVVAYCFVTEMMAMVFTRTASLGDLLMLFLYVEVLVMARAAMHSDHELTIAMPIAIAVVAIGRYMVMSSDHNASHQLMYAGSIFVLVGALCLWRWRKKDDKLLTPESAKSEPPKD